MRKRSHTLGPRRLGRLANRDAREGKTLAADHERPRVRGECRSMPRPCPFVGCRYHLFLEVNARGGIAFPHGEDVSVLMDMAHTCALDRADRGKTTIVDVAAQYRMTTAWVGMIMQSALARLGLHQGLAEMSPRGRQPAYDPEKYITDYHFPLPHREVVRRREAARIFAEATLAD